MQWVPGVTKTCALVDQEGGRREGERERKRERERRAVVRGRAGGGGGRYSLKK